MSIDAEDLRRRFAGIEPIGLGTAGTTRLAWTAEDAAAADWFAEQAHSIGLRFDRDRAGNLWACPSSDPPWWALGSHLDSVRGGGRFDGALGVAAAFAVAERSPHPVAVISFADEEGGRCNTPTFGSRALTGALDVESVLARRDRDGTSLADAIAATGLDPAGVAAAPERLPWLRGFIELHIDQSLDVAASGRPYGVVTSLAERMRTRVALRGKADHAGTTPMDQRRDALAAAAQLIVALLDSAEPDSRVTPSRIVAQPNASTTIASHVETWFDVRAATAGVVGRWLESAHALVPDVAVATGVDISLAVESHSPPTAFDPHLTRALHDLDGAPLVVCWAGHDAGVLSRHVPAAMVLVRNATGVSHTRSESVELVDAASASSTLLALLDRLHVAQLT